MENKMINFKPALYTCIKHDYKREIYATEYPTIIFEDYCPHCMDEFLEKAIGKLTKVEE